MPTFNEFSDLVKSSEIKKMTAGVAVIYNKHILLVHPTNASWSKSALGIPKGGIEDGEDAMDAAVRELMEETGISIDTKDLNPEPRTVPMYDKNGEIDRMLIYFELRISDLSQIGMDSFKINKNKLQLEEIDWAGFVPIMDAYPKIHREQLIILDRSI